MPENIFVKFIQQDTPTDPPNQTASFNQNGALDYHLVNFHTTLPTLEISQIRRLLCQLKDPEMPLCQRPTPCLRRTLVPLCSWKAAMSIAP
jgi:hypothetical protein